MEVASLEGEAEVAEVPSRNFPPPQFFIEIFCDVFYNF